MKIVYAILLAASAGFCVFSSVYGYKASSLRSSGYGSSRYGSGYGYRRSTSRRSSWDDFASRRSSLHNIVRTFSLIYFVGAIAVFVNGAIFTRSIAWRVLTIIAASISLVMAIWSCILSGGVSYDEVFIAWIVASVLFLAMSTIGLFLRNRPRPQRHAA